MEGNCLVVLYVMVIISDRLLDGDIDVAIAIIMIVESGW